MRVEAAGVSVVLGGWVERVPLAQHAELGTDFEGFVGACHEERGGMFSPAVGGFFSTRGKRERPSLSGLVRWASASSRRYFRMGGEWTGVRQFSGR